MKNWKKYVSILLALVMCLSLAACGGDDDAGKIDIEDLEGFWYPVEGIGSTSSILTCIYIAAANETWTEYDQYGDPTGCSGDAVTDGITLTLKDVPLIGDVEIPIGDTNTLVTDTGETYWVKGRPDFKDKPELSSSYYGKWYLRGDHTSEFATVLTLNEDGTYSRYGMEGTYTYREYEQNVGNSNTTVLRREIALSESMNEMYYLVSDGQVLAYWASSENGDNYYIREDALDNEQLLTECSMTSGSFSGTDYAFYFNRDYTLMCYFYGTSEERCGTWKLTGDTVAISWDDGETDEAVLVLSNEKLLTLSSTGETLNNPW